MARLDGPKSWMPLNSDTDKYLQIDLAPHRYVIGQIAVKGDRHRLSSSSYKVKYKDSNGNWKTVGKKVSGSFAERVSLILIILNYTYSLYHMYSSDTPVENKNNFCKGYW